MTRVIMVGCNGKMGRYITDIIAKDPECEIVAGIDPYDGIQNTYPVFPTFATCNVEADVVIDFSNVSVVSDMLKECTRKNLPIVLCTTGLTEDLLLEINETSKKIAILKSANMSLGVNLLLEALQPIAKILSPAGFDIEIVEKHHNQKLDAPSGTAMALADSINEALNNEFTYKFDRSQEMAKRDSKEIGISAVRGGNIVGDHEVIFAGQDEVIEIKHTAYSKALFAKGAVEAAKFLAGKPAGMYNMRDVINSKQ